MTKEQMISAIKILIDKLNDNTISPEELELINDLINWHKGHSFSSWDKVIKEFKNFPMTWYPALILDLVEAAYKKNVFNPGGCSLLVKEYEKKHGYNG